MGTMGHATEWTTQQILNNIESVVDIPKRTLRTIDHLELIAEGKAEDHISGGAIGSQYPINTGAFVILSNIAVIQPAANMQMQIVSTSVNDTAAGSGAQEVDIVYLPYEWSDEYSWETIVMDGTTPVNTVATNIYRIEDFAVTKGRSADGNITLKDTGAVNTYAQIDQYTNFFQRSIHYVRTGYRSIVTDIAFGCSTNGGVIWRLFRTIKKHGHTTTRGRLSIEVADNTLNHAWKMSVVCYNPDGDNMAIGLAVAGINANQRGTGTFRFYDWLQII